MNTFTLWDFGSTIRFSENLSPLGQHLKQAVKEDYLQNFCEDKGQNGYGIVQHVELSILAKSVLVDVTDAGLATRSSLTEKIQMPC